MRVGAWRTCCHCEFPRVRSATEMQGATVACVAFNRVHRNKDPKSPTGSRYGQTSEENRQKTARHDPELIEAASDDGLIQNLLFGAAEEHGLQHMENGHGSDTVASIFGHGCGHFQ